MLQAKFNKKFESLIRRYQIKDAKFAIAVSGGADSLALALLMKSWAKKNKKIKIVALTVDHKLREESVREADMVNRLMTNAGVEHKTLVWGGIKPKKGMEEAARNARYKLLSNWCKDNGIKYIMTAHHKMDQAETFLMRLQRGSGVDGLSGMSEIVDIMDVQIMRPLLNFMPSELKNFLANKQINWVEDPHNDSDEFLRVRIRKILPVLEDKIGITVSRIVDTQRVLSRTKAFLNECVDKFISDYARQWSGCGVSFSLADFNKQHDEMKYRIISRTIREVGENNYVPRAASVDTLVSSLAEKGFNSATLGGCEIIVFKGSLFIIKELKTNAKLAKKEWDNFVAKNRKYDNVDVPYKLKRVLCCGKLMPI